MRKRVNRSNWKSRWALGLALASLVPLLGVAPASADVDQKYIADDERPGRVFSLGGRAMYFRAEDADEGHLHGGAQLRLYFLRLLAIEGSADYRRTTFPGTRVDVFPVQASMLIYIFPGAPVSPYLLGGGGWYFTHVDGPAGFDETNNRFGPHAGGGLQLFINRYLSIDGSYRYVWVEDVNSLDETNLLNKDFRDRGSMMTLALNLHF